MIIIGYPGVGKTTAAANFIQVIDFESHILDKKTPEAITNYCKLAESLSKQGYIVCVSSHFDVMDYLAKSTEQIYICYPNKDLKQSWIAMLRHRYMEDSSEKNLRAMERVGSFFNEDIDAMQNTVFDKVELSEGVFLSNVLTDSFNQWEQENMVPDLESSEEIVDVDEVENDS